jgi:hypothetical protein
MFDNIKQGEVSNRVKTVQTALRALRKYNGDLDGDFGPKTLAALIAWETDFHDLGQVDETEFAVLSDIAAKEVIIQLPTIISSKKELLAIYGQPWINQSAWAAANLSYAKVPATFRNAIPNLRIYCHRYIVPVVEETFAKLDHERLSATIKTFDGCWNVRPVRGYENAKPPIYSIHSWALALDLNEATNELGTKGSQDSGMLLVFKELGWVWGGDFPRQDPMHFQMVAANVY